MKLSTWGVLLDSLFDSDGFLGHRLRGVDLLEWCSVMQHEYDDVDALYLEYDTIGG